MSDEPHVDGMGALPYDGGTAFRVWAPHADQVSIKGDFNWWSDSWTPMRHEGWGYWYGTVAGLEPGAHYKYHIDNAWMHFDRGDPYAARVDPGTGNSVVHRHGWFDWQWDNFRCPPFHELVIYEVHVGAFDTSWGGRGTFDRLIERIGHLQYLGVNAIELMPVMEFPGEVSWGYNPSHPFAVESSYGGPDALKRLVLACHRAGIAVIVDVVYNHFGPTDLPLWQFDGWSENELGGIYFYNDDRAHTPWGSTRPDYARGEVRQYIRDNALMWMFDYHVDGLRFDATPFIRSTNGLQTDLPEGYDLMRWVTDELRSRYPERILIAEDMQARPDITAPGGAGFHAQWDGDFVHPVRRALITPADADRSMQQVREAIEHRINDTPFTRVIFTESHDESANGHARLTNEINPGDQHGWWAQKRSTLGAAITLTSPGIPMLLMGQEFLQGGSFDDHVALDWWQAEVHQGVLRLYRDLVHLRRNLWGGTEGLMGEGLNVFHVNDWDKLIAYQRWAWHGAGDDVVVVANFSSHVRWGYELGFPAGGRWRLRFNSDAGDYSPIFGNFPSKDVWAEEGSRDGLSHHATVDVAPYTALIYSWDG